MMSGFIWSMTRPTFFIFQSVKAESISKYVRLHQIVDQRVLEA
jgi:hypothetical protein